MRYSRRQEGFLLISQVNISKDSKPTSYGSGGEGGGGLTCGFLSNMN